MGHTMWKLIESLLLTVPNPNSLLSYYMIFDCIRFNIDSRAIEEVYNMDQQHSKIILEVII